VIISCSKISSGGFWKNFKNSEIVFEKLDHGPYGGTTEIHWQGKKKFNTNEIIEFAKTNDWELVNPTKADLDFPNKILKYRFNTSELQNKTIVYLKSNLMTIEEDKKLETQINCFAILDSKKNKLIIYHCWGDF
jgi:hypothetical protein